MLRRAGGIAFVAALALALQSTGNAAYAADPPPPPWSGSVSLSSDRAYTDANETSARLTATISSPLRDSLSVSIYDDTNVRHHCSSYTGGTTFTISVAPATNTSRTYRAYVAADCPSGASPASDVRASSGGPTVTNLGYTGSVTMTADTTRTTANDTSARLSLTLTKYLPSPYSLSIYDDLGVRHYCTTYPGTSFSTSVAPATNATRTYTAYVAQDCPSTGRPVNDVKSSSAVTVSNVGFDGTLTMTTDRTTTTANDTSARLTLALSKYLPSPYSLSIYDDLGVRHYCTTYPGTSFSTSVAPATNATRTYTAYVAQGCPSSGQPTTDVKASTAVTVANVGYDGTLTMTSDRTTTSANDTSARLTLTLSKYLPSPYSLSIYDDLGVRHYCTTYPGTSFSTSVAPATNAARTYTAYVAQGCPSTGKPTTDVKASTAVTVANVGYDGTLTMTADRTRTTANESSARLDLTLSKYLPSPYSLSIYDETGVRHFCSTYTGTTFSTSVAPPLNTTRTYTAYVAQGCPSTGKPTTDVKATATVTVTNAGYDGTVSVSADTTTTDANSSSARLTLTLSKPLASPYYLTVFDETGARHLCTSYNSASHTVSVSPPLSQSRTYTAYVALDCPGSGKPVNDVKTTASITITNLGYTGSISFTTDRATTDANNTSARLTADLTKSLPGGFSFAIYDDRGARPYCTTYNSNQYVTSVSPPLHESRTYTAYVFPGGCPSTAAPANATSSGAITVTNVGYSGTLTFVADRAETTADAPQATLTATLSPGLPGGYSFVVYDDTGARHYCTTYNSTTYSLAVSPPLDTTRVYTAYVAQGCGSTAPTGWVDAEASVGVTRYDPGGASVSIAVRNWQPDAEGGTVSYDLSAVGSRLAASDGPCRTESCSWTVAGYATDPQTGVKSHVQTLGSGSLPAGSMQLAETFTASAAMVAFTSVELTVTGSAVSLGAAAGVATTMEGLLIAEIEAYLLAQAVSQEELCVEVASAPQPRPTSSLGTFGEACVAASSVSTALIAIAAVTGGAGILIYVLNRYHGTDTTTAPPPTTEPGTEPTSQPVPSVPEAPVITHLEPSVELVVAEWLTKKRVRATTSVETLKKVARRCLDVVSRSVPLVTRWQSSGRNPCETMPIYFPGSDVGAARDHRSDAIYTVNPDWALNTYEARAVKKRYVSERWYAGEPECQDPQGRACDEFPNFSSVKGGPAKPGRVRASLRLMSGTDNSTEGSRYGGFVTSCGLRSAADDSGASGGDEFLTVPMAGLAVPTWWLCSIPL